jgi:protoporphyrinogen oxidase
MKEFAPYTCQDGYYNITCEVTDSQSQAQYFDDPDRYTQPIVDELVDMAFLKDRKFVERIECNRIVDTYPIYHKRYLKDFAAVRQTVKEFSQNIHLLGRCGAFWYNNSDHSMRMAIELAQELIGDHEHRFNYRRYF